MSNALTLHWDTRVLGCLFLPMLAMVALFGLAALEPSLAAGLTDTRRGGFIAFGQVGRFNWMSGGLALLIGAVAIKSGWRWADIIAVRANDEGLVLHPSIRRRPLNWSELSVVTYLPLRSTGSLAIGTRDGDTFKISQIDPEQGPLFARAVTERWLALPPAT